MKTTIQLLAAIAICCSVQSCGSDDASEEETTNAETPTNSEDNPSQSNDNAGNESNPEANSTKDEDLSYFIMLDTDAGELNTGMTTGKINISDDMICTVGDWRMRILTDEFRPNNMVGEYYNAHIISDEYNSNNCSCQMMSVDDTGEKASVGEYVRMEGEITCDEGAVTGTFTVKMIDQEK